MSKEEFDLCGFCCKWANGLEGKSPVAVRDAYPRMMRKVLKHRFGIKGKAADRFIREACEGNWSKLYETEMESSAEAEDFAYKLRWDVFYCSDRWSRDRVLRIQWLYRLIVRRCERWEAGR